MESPDLADCSHSGRSLTSAHSLGIFRVLQLNVFRTMSKQASQDRFGVAIAMCAESFDVGIAQITFLCTSIPATPEHRRQG